MIITGQPELGLSAERVIDALRSRGPLTRRQLEDATGYSRPTLSRTLTGLLDEGHLVEVDDPGAPAGRGRPSRLIRLNPGRADCIGLEIARAHVAVAIADGSGAVVAADHTAVRPSAGLTARARSAIALTRRLARQHDLDLDQLRRVVAGIPGPQSPTRTAAADRSATSVRRLLTESFGADVRLGNNTKLTAMAEATTYAGRATGDLIFVRLDEGVGGGFVIDGSLATGRGAAGEFGHVCVDPRGRACACGGRGCLETIASLPALLAALGADSPDALNATDRRTRSVIRKAAEATGQVLAGAIATLHPRVVVLGGRVAALPGFAARAEDTMRALAPDWTGADLAVEVADEDRRAGALGALAQARTG